MPRDRAEVSCSPLLSEPGSGDAEHTHLTSCFAFHRIFSSNLKERMAQRFYNLVLLPRVRDDIAEYKRLNFHLYMALKKALFKPGAWFKGRGSLWGCTPPVGACCTAQQLGRAVCCTALLLYTALCGCGGSLWWRKVEGCP